MPWWLLKSRMWHRLTRRQKKAIAGMIPMTKDLFWDCLGALFQRNEMDKFWDIWHRHPEFIQDWNAAFERGMASSNSELRKEHDTWWSNLRKKLVDSFGEEWVKENCKEEV